MVDLVAVSSIFIHRPLYGGCLIKGNSCRRVSALMSRFPSIEFLGIRFGVSPSRGGFCVSSCGEPRAGTSSISPIRALAMELTKEAYSYREEERIPREFGYPFNVDVDSKPGLWPPQNRADDPSLKNPLLRQERMGCGWLGAIFEWEGVLVEDNPDLENQAWLALSQEEGKSPPPAFLLRRIEGMKNEQAISEVLCWSRDPATLKRLASRKEEIYQALQGGVYALRDGSREFVNVLMHYKVPMALVSTRPRKTVENGIRSIRIGGYFTAVVAAEDVHRGKPDPEMFIYAAQLLQFIPERCIVFGNSNLTVEAAHDARMKCVAVASKHPVYELGAADLVVRHLDELSVVDLKNLADIESADFTNPELEMEMEMEEEEGDDYQRGSTSLAAVDDNLWQKSQSLSL